MGSRQGYFLFISEKEIEINTIDLTVGNIFGLFSFPEFCLPNQDPYVYELWQFSIPVNRI